MPMAEHAALVEALTLAWTGQAAGEQVTIPAPIGAVTGRPEIYRPLLAMLEAGPMSVRQMRETPALAQRPLLEVLQAVALLITGGFAHPVVPGGDSEAARAGAAALNRAIADANAIGADMPRLAVPLTGSALNVDMLETMVVGELLAGKPAELAGLTTAVLGLLQRSGRSVQREGKPVTDPVVARGIVAEVMETLLERRLPLLRRLGVVG
jgi:hypothetical protein